MYGIQAPYVGKGNFDDDRYDAEDRLEAMYSDADDRIDYESYLEEMEKQEGKER